MNVCPKVIHIRNSKKNNHTASFQSDRISLEEPTTFGFKEFISNCPQGLEIQCLFCSSYEPTLCKGQWFNSHAQNKVCENAITSKSNFHLCLKLPENEDILYIYFQKKSEKLTQEVIGKIIDELKSIRSFNGHDKSHICVAILLCGLPCCGTSNIAAKRNNCINELQQENIRHYLKDLSARAGILTLIFSPSSSYPCNINIERSVARF